MPRPFVAVMHFVEDTHATAAWWATHLGGFTRADGDFAWFVYDGVEISFHPADEAKNPHGASTVIYWHAPEFETRRAQLIEAGCTPWRGPLALDDGRQICQLRDPYGVVFGLDSGFDIDA